MTLDRAITILRNFLRARANADDLEEKALERILEELRQAQTDLDDCRRENAIEAAEHLRDNQRKANIVYVKSEKM